MDEVKDFRLTLAPESATNNGLNKLKLQAQTQLAIMAVEQKFLEEAIMHNQTVLTTMEDTKETGQSLDKTVASRRKQDAISENIRIMTKEWEKINRANSVHYKLLSLPEHYLLALSQGKTLGVKIDGQEVKVNRESLTRGANIANEAFSKAIGKTVTHEKVEEPYLFDQIDTKAIKKEVERAMSEASIKNKEITVGDVVERVTEQFQNREASQKKGPSEEQLREMLGISTDKAKPEEPVETGIFNKNGDIIFGNEETSAAIPLPAGDPRLSLSASIESKKDNQDILKDLGLGNVQNIVEEYNRVNGLYEEQEKRDQEVNEQLQKVRDSGQQLSEQVNIAEAAANEAEAKAEEQRRKAEEAAKFFQMSREIQQKKKELYERNKKIEEKQRLLKEQEELNNEMRGKIENYNKLAEKNRQEGEAAGNKARMDLEAAKQMLTDSFNITPNSGSAIFEPKNNMGRKK